MNDPGAPRVKAGCLWALMAATIGCTSPTAEVPPPNVVVIVVDDMRWDDFGLGGHPFVETPNIDRVGREGAMFLNAFATTPLCSPSRASILTGRYAHSNGVIDNTDRSAISHEFESFPRTLDRGGYETAFIGKWHMGNDDSARPGFDHWVAMRGQGEAIDPVLNVNGERSAHRGYVTDVLTEHAVNFVSEAEGPFALFLAHKALHPNVAQRNDGSTAALVGQRAGFIPAPRHEGRYASDIPPRRPSYGVPPVGRPALDRVIEDLPPLGLGTVTSDETIRQRLEMLLAVDESVGQILSTLEKTGRLDQTVLVVTSDHGYFYGEHGLSAERRLAYEETIRVPMIVRYPARIPAGITEDRFALLIDLAPTVLDLTRTPAPTNLQGRSLMALIDDSAESWRESFLVEYYSDTVFRRMDRMGYKAVRTTTHKYINYLDLEGADELYDLVVDPYELDNRIGDPEMDSLRAALQGELARLLAETEG